MRPLAYQHQKKKFIISSNPLPLFSLHDFAAALAAGRTSIDFRQRQPIEPNRLHHGPFVI